ncbi:WD repeat domain-containing protein [Forsythia ovata]|uniref:WD repeat domain-containing protein n=1 Tax=Forsythia ovata TaxID=205694 RepID=A0ABD1T4N1_9LAMI
MDPWSSSGPCQLPAKRKRYKPTTVDALGHDVFYMIFALLDLVHLIRCSAVCKSWYFLSHGCNRLPRLPPLFNKNHHGSLEFVGSLSIAGEEVYDICLARPRPPHSLFRRLQIMGERNRVGHGKRGLLWKNGWRGRKVSNQIREGQGCHLRWQPLLASGLKLNSDVAVKKENDFMNVRAVIRDEFGGSYGDIHEEDYGTFYCRMRKRAK